MHLLAALLLVATVSPSYWGAQQQHPNNPQNSATDTKTAHVVSVFDNQQSTTAQANKTTTQPDNRPHKPPWWDVTWATWALVAVGIAGTLAAIYTLAAIRRQTESLIRSERAWIMVDIEWVPGYGGIVRNSSLEDGVVVNYTTFPIRIICKNEGNTPAWITEISAQSQIYELIHHQPPKTPDLQSTKVSRTEPIPVAAKMDVSEDISLSSRGVLGNLGVDAIVYGVVRYRDMFSANRDRETTFGYKLSYDEKTFVRIAEYNKNT